MIMCLLIATTGTARPSKKALRRAAIQNPDGFGFAVITGNEIYTYKSMESEAAIKHYFEVRDEFPNAESIFHLRITTHGATNIDNCHPFRVNDDVVMGHNGMLPIKEDKGRSDSRVFAEDWLPEFDLGDLLDTQDGMAELENFAGASKLAFLNTSSLLRQSLYIVNEELGHWDNGVWYSNNSYKKSYGYYTIGRSSGWSPTTPTYKVTDRRAVTPSDYESSFNYRPYSSQDLVWDDVEKAWSFGWDDVDREDDVELEDDVVYWTCSGCNSTEVYDMQFDEPEFCPECGNCWYCERPWNECYCISLNEEF
jgi:glutamine amidotransferase